MESPETKPSVNEAVTRVIRAQPGPQTWLLACPAFELLFGGGRGGGKTVALILFAIAHEARYGRNANMVFFRRSMPEFSEIQRLCQSYLPELGWVYKEQKATWIAPSGGRLLFRYLERDADADSYKGMSFSLLGIDEVADWPSPEPVDKLRATVRSGMPGMLCQMVMTGNPGGAGHEWCKERYIGVASPNTIFTNQFGLTQCFIPSRITDNLALLENDPDYVKRLYASGPRWLVKAWLDGDWDIVMEGKIFKREMLQYGPLPKEVKNRLEAGEMPMQIFDYVVQAWDTAIKEKEDNDYSALTVWGKHHGKYYLLDAWRGKYTFGKIKVMMGEFYKKWGAHYVLIEDKGSGQNLIQELFRDPVMPTHIIVPTRPLSQGGSDKYARASTVVPVFEAGIVIFPEEAPWLDSYVNELLSFQPKCAHDDWVDSTVYALDYLSHKLLYDAHRKDSTFRTPTTIYAR